jgi:hypothetical protein
MVRRARGRRHAPEHQTMQTAFSTVDEHIAALACASEAALG